MIKDNNDDNMMRLCGGSWVCCNGKCNECQTVSYTATSSTDQISDKSEYTNHT